MKYFQERIVEEKSEIDIKIVELAGFIYSDKFVTIEKEQQDLLERQLYAMMVHSNCLKDRITNLYY